MRNYLLLVTALFFHQQIFAQVTPQDPCGTPSPATPIYIDEARAQLLRPLITSPYLVRVFVHIVADDNGTNAAATEADVLRQLANMRNFYAAHNICFILAGIEQVNSSDLNNMDVSEETELTSFFVSNCMDIFIHSTLRDGSKSLNGSAYQIPNTYLSIVGSAVASTTNLSTLAHEIGHDFGLYHTFETFGGDKPENVARSGTCRNCNVNGDLLCDTEADGDESVNSSCVYSGTLTDGCGELFAPNTHNIMSYGDRSCRDMLTTGQGQRAVGMISITTNLSNTLAPDDLSASSSVSYSSGKRFLVARNTVSVSASSYVVSGSTIMTISANSVTITAGARFTPGTDGSTRISANNLCQ